MRDAVDAMSPTVDSSVGAAKMLLNGQRDLSTCDAEVVGVGDGRSDHVRDRAENGGVA